MTTNRNNIRLFHKGQTFGGPQKVVDNLVKGLKSLEIEIEGSFSSRGAKYNGCLQHPLSSCPNDKDYEKSFYYHGGRKVLMGPNLFVIPNEDPKLCASFDHFIVPSQWVLNLYRQFPEMNNKTIDIWPVGIDTEQWHDIKRETPSLGHLGLGYKCLIYFKGRSTQDLELTKNLLKHFRINYQIVEYGQYSERELLSACNWANFCILLTNTESQGIAYLEILSTNLPCYVLNKNYWDYDGKYKKVPASSVPYFDERCGMIIDNAISVSHFKTFLEKLDTFKPREYILENFTLEKRAQEYYDLLVKYQG